MWKRQTAFPILPLGLVGVCPLREILQILPPLALNLKIFVAFGISCGLPSHEL
jgi:hypothetical protein